MGKGRRRSHDVPDVEPLDVDGVRTIAVFTVLWAIAFVVLALRKGALDEAGYGWWLWTCLSGVGLGLLGIEHARRRRDAIAEAQLLAEADDDHESDDSRDDERLRADPEIADDGRPGPGVVAHADPHTHRVVEPLTDPGAPLPALPSGGPPTDPRAVTRPIESTTPRRLRPDPTARPDTVAPGPHLPSEPGAAAGRTSSPGGARPSWSDGGTGSDHLPARRPAPARPPEVIPPTPAAIAYRSQCSKDSDRIDTS